jgi:hypothetical protein
MVEVLGIAQRQGLRLLILFQLLDSGRRISDILAAVIPGANRNPTVDLRFLAQHLGHALHQSRASHQRNCLGEKQAKRVNAELG